MVASNRSRTRSMYFSCQLGKLNAAKMVRLLGFFGSKAVDLPLAIFLAAWASALVMLLLLVLMYSLAAVRVGLELGVSDGHWARWIVSGFLRTSSHIYSAQWGAMGVMRRACRVT